MKTKLFFMILFITFNVGFAQNWAEKSTLYNNSTNATSVLDVSIVDQNIIWTTPINNNITTVNQISKSLDGGMTWSSTNTNLPQTLILYGISAVSATKAWVIGYDSTTFANTGVYVTIDGGAIWTKQSTALFNDPNTSFPDNIHFFDENNGVVTGDQQGGYFEIYTTTDGGTTWVRVPQANIPAPDTVYNEFGVTSFFVSLPSSDIIWFVSLDYISPNYISKVYKSTDKGNNWSVVNTLSNFNLSAISFSDTSTGYIVGKNTGSTTSLILKTIDGGNTYTDITAMGTGLPSTIDRMSCIIGSSMVVVSSGASTYYNFNPGVNNWIQFGTQTKNITRLKFYDQNTGFAGTVQDNTGTGGIFKFLNTVSLIGSNISTAWTTDVDLTTSDGINYTLSNYVMVTGEAKFRQNHAWNPTSVDWGNTTFPTGTGINGGSNIPITAGTYNVSFNRDSGDYDFQDVLSTSTTNAKVFSIYPNPASNILTIQSDKTFDNIIVTDITGKKILETTSTTINIENLAGGVYIIELYSGSNKYNEKFIKE